MPPSKAMLCLLALLPLAQASANPPPPPALADALAGARMAEPEAVARALIEVVRINPATTDELGPAGWLADLRGFDGPERHELSDILRKEGVGLADRSKLRRLVTAAAAQSIAMKPPLEEARAAAAGVPRRAQEADGREESATSTQLKKQQGDHAGTAQPGGKVTGDGSGLSSGSASP